MARIEKFSDGAVVNELRHNNRLIIKDSNPDIDPERTHLNYSLTPYIDVPKSEYSLHRSEIRRKEQEYYRQRKSELYCYNRKDVKTMAGCIVTCPKEIVSAKEQERFFKATASFLSQRYGSKNVISITVHYDEGKLLKLTDETGQVLRDAQGSPMTEFRLGQPHLHFCWIPACKIDHGKLDYQVRNGKLLAEEIKRDPESGRYYIDRKFKLKKGQKIPTRNVPKAMREMEEKISANDVLNKAELQHLHTDFQEFLDKHGINGNVHSGITAAQGGNRTVKELKQDTDRIQEFIRNVERENAGLRSQNRSLRQENDILKERVLELEKGHLKERFKTGWGKGERTFEHVR